MVNRGKLAAVLMVGMSVLAAGLSVWWHYRQGRRAQQFWGSRAALLIRRAPKVAALLLREGQKQPRAAGERLLIDGQWVGVVSSKDISRAPGLVHARHALLEDASFRWGTGPGSCRGTWTCALRFSDGDRRATVLLDFQCRRTKLVGKRGELSVSDRVMAGLRTYTADQFEAPAPSRD